MSFTESLTNTAELDTVDSMTDSSTTESLTTAPETTTIDEADLITNDPKLTAMVEQVDQIRDAIQQTIVGQKEVVNQMICAFLAGGHILFEGVPGLGKTLMVRALSTAFNGNFGRIQFTPDLMPADVMGHAFYNAKEQAFTIRKGPVFTNLLLADEINRAPAKTQSALLEVMQERQVTIEGESHPVQAPFMVLATQNPLEQEGTYPLPEAQLDRFLLKVLIEYPEADHEFDLVSQASSSRDQVMQLSDHPPVTETAAIIELQEYTGNLAIDREVLEYAVNIVRQTRTWPGIAVGAGPRGGISLIRAAKAHALIQHRNFVMPEDIKSMALPTLRHRISLTAEMEIEGRTNDELLMEILDETPAPRL